MEPLIGQIMMFAGTFAPKGWAYCEGQLISISQNQALYSILGNTYGGDGINNFALPDLRGRAPIHKGHGPGLSPINLGEQGGTEKVTLDMSNMPAHNHALNVSNSAGTSFNPEGNVPAASQFQENRQSPVINVNSYNGNFPNTAMSPSTISVQGGNQPFNSRNPYLGINYIIALEGVYPMRD
ncbi:tail fiber protein [Belliella sp. R4-6]|uniref:Tail fiber protein n=1 Tax=Belliella alkalica TaxID=1730871 RepID=A0ABS9V6Q8_9BACT|nr:tail fiber protein [Belliella alkalica]MCH7412102.1 tail fiber protein [Belliella alkalica]